MRTPERRLSRAPLVELEGVTHRYWSRQVLTDVSLGVGPQVLGLLGPNGADKTTMLSIMATVLRPTSGRVRVECLDVVSDPIARRARRHIGFLPQRVPIVASYTALDMVRCSAWLRGVDGASERRASQECLDKVGLADTAGRRMKTLSGGMVQRVGLACALVGDPTALLLDEPTAGLDPAQRLQFRDVLRSLEGVAVVLSTHMVEDVAVVADKLVIVNAGRARFEGTPGELSAQGHASFPGDTERERGYMRVLSDAHAVDGAGTESAS